MSEQDRTLLRQLSRLEGPDCPSLAALGTFLDGKGEREERETIEMHLRGCPACVNRLIDLRELAYLETEGEEPPPALVERLKRLVPTKESASASPPVLRERIADALATWRAALRWWLAPRPLGGVLAVSVVALFLFFVGPTLWQQQSGNVILTAEMQRMLGAMALSSTEQGAWLKQLETSLEKVPKNLLLEETRGATNVEVYKKAAPATVLVVTKNGFGSGIVISTDGEVLTNWHVIQNETHAAVVFKPQKGVAVRRDLAFAARLIKVDQVADLALLQILAPPPDLPVLSLGDLTEVEVGQDVHAIGHPEGEVWTYTTGIISQVRPQYQWKGENHLSHQGTVIQTQTALNPGNSGGPLLNDQAEVIGINSFRGEGEGLNYAVAVDVVKSFLRQTKMVAAPSTPQPRSFPYKTEAYGPHIVGVYTAAHTPPPDLWFYRGAPGKEGYLVRGYSTMTQLDTVIWQDTQSGVWTYAFDPECDGNVNVLGYDVDGDGEVDRYSAPAEPLRIADLAKELVQALQQGVIPYPQVRVCR